MREKSETEIIHGVSRLGRTFLRPIVGSMEG